MSEVSAKRRKLTRDRNDEQKFCDLTITHDHEKIVLHRCLFGTTFSFFDDLFSKVAVDFGIVEIEDSNKFQRIKDFINNIYEGRVVEDPEIILPEGFEKVVDDTDQSALDKFVRHQLNSDRFGSQKYCDVTISTGTRQFHVHKSIVAVQFEYFNKLFTTEMKEKHQSTCHISEIDDESMALVFDFIYTKKIWVNQDMLNDLLAVTDYFCMKEFSDEIENCIVEMISHNNCIDIWIAGIKFKKQILIQHAEQQICAHVFFIINSNQFRNIDQLYMEDFIKLIKGKVSDDQLMKCALLWIKHDMDKRMEKFEMFYDMIEPKSLSQSTWVLLINMKNLVSQNFAAAKAVIPYMRQFVPNAQTELALDTMYVMCQSGDVYSCDMSALKPKAFDNHSIFVPKWVKIKTADYNISKRSLPLIYGFEKLYAIDYDKAWSLRDANWQDEVRLTTRYSEGAVAFVGDTLYVASGTFNCKLESYKKDFSGQRTTQHSSMKYDRSCFALVPYDGYLFAIGCKRNTKPTSKNKRRQQPGLSVLPSVPIEVYTIKSNTWETLTLSGPDILNVKMYLVRQNRAYIVHGDDTIQVATFDLARRQWVTGMNAETGIVERCASLTLGFPDFGSCTMGPPLPANTFGSAASFGSGLFGR